MSFSAEMKDFLNAYKTGQSINASKTDQDYKAAQQDATEKKTTRDNDPDTLELADKQARAKLSLTQAQIAASGVNNQYKMGLLKAMQGGQPAVPGSGLMPTNPAVGPQGPQPVPQGQGALPIGPSTLNTGEEAYADGGLVDDGSDTEPDADADETQQGAVNPSLDLTAPTDTPTDVSSRSRGLHGVVSPTLVRDAVLAGSNYGAQKYGVNQMGAVHTPTQKALAQAYVAGHSGLTDEEMDAARHAVDPDGKMTDMQRNAAALGSVYQFWANKGDDEKASRVAFQMLQHYRAASQRYAAIAAHAAQGGNIDLATKAAMKAYSNIPDGKDISLEPNPDGGIMYSMTGPHGEDIVKGIATPQQLYSSAMGLVTGGFDKALLTAAGQPLPEAPKGAKAPTAAERAGQEKLINPAAKDYVTAQDEIAAKAKPGAAPLGDDYTAELSSNAQHLMQQNPQLTSAEAVRAAHVLLQPGSHDPEKMDFKVTEGEDGEHTVNIGGKLKVKVSADQLDAFANSRAARIKAATDKIDSNMSAQDTPSRTDQALEGAKQAGTGVLNLAKGVAEGGPQIAVASKALDALKSIYGDHIPQSVKDAVVNAGGAIKDIAGRAASAVGRGVSNQGAIPVDGSDSPL